MLVVRLEDPACQAVGSTGGKAANLSRLAKNYAVPPGFCLTTEAYARWASAEDQAEMPSDIRESLVTAYAALAHGCGTSSPRVAVRSSAISEDGKSASFAGQYSSYLNMSGVDAVAEAVMQCWASAQTPRVEAYQKHQGQPLEAQPVAVLVQQLIPADVAFVAFSADPVTGYREEAVVNSNWGLGESIVNGIVVPDTYVVRKSDWTLTRQVIGGKVRMTVVRTDGVKDVNVPRLMRTQSTLTNAQAIAIAQLASRLETEMNWPVDIEGAIQGDCLYLLQCRPITTL